MYACNIATFSLRMGRKYATLFFRGSDLSAEKTVQRLDKVIVRIDVVFHHVPSRGQRRQA
jgi:hypothetical protein